MLYETPKTRVFVVRCRRLKINCIFVNRMYLHNILYYNMIYNMNSVSHTIVVIDEFLGKIIYECRCLSSIGDCCIAFRRCIGYLGIKEIRSFKTQKNSAIDQLSAKRFIWSIQTASNKRLASYVDLLFPRLVKHKQIIQNSMFIWFYKRLL